MTSSRREKRLEALLRDHRAAVREFVDRANAITDSRWLVPRGEGKWTPAQETKHLILAYEAFSRDLRGEKGMSLRGTPFRRLVWRIVGLTSILWRERIPIAVRAPREARPDWEAAPRAELVPRLEACADEFNALFTSAWRTNPRRRVTHPFFGTLSLEHSIRMNSVHTRHHAAFLPPRPSE
jgi:DinB family protein